jgi:hypothetical protein
MHAVIPEYSIIFLFELIIIPQTTDILGIGGLYQSLMKKRH